MRYSAAFAEKLFDSVPWHETDVSAFEKSDFRWERSYRRIEDVEFDERLDFHADRWDISAFWPDRRTMESVVSFSDYTDALSLYLKFYVLWIIGERGLKPSTAIRRMSDFHAFWMSVRSLFHIGDIEELDTAMVQHWFRNHDAGQSHKRSVAVSLCSILEFIEEHFHVALSVDMDKLVELKDSADRAVRRSDRRIEEIPEDDYTSLLGCFLKVMEGEEYPYVYRMTAALMVVETETGFRREDLLTLTEDMLREETVSSETGPHSVMYLHYVNHKTSTERNVIDCDVYCSERVQKAIRVLIELRNENGYANPSGYIYMLKLRKDTGDGPVESATFRYLYRNLVMNYMAEPPQHIPNLPQYRVTLASRLYRSGVSLSTIRKTLGHMSSFMEGYYCRPANSDRQDLEAARMVLDAIMDDDSAPLYPGSGEKDDGLLERIRNFIKAGNINVHEDIESVMAEFGDRLHIRAKVGGYCIKGSQLECAEDRTTNEYLCMYGLCPNIRHFYFDAAQSLADYRKTCLSIGYAQEKGHRKDAEKEKRKKMAIARNRLKPELEELGRVIESRGKVYVLSVHPELGDVVEQLDGLMEELENDCKD